MKKKFEIIEHTADVRFRIFGRDLKEIFENAVWVLAWVAVGEPPKKLPLRERIEISAPDENILLGDFLNEILAKTQIKKAVFPRLEIIELCKTRVVAQILGAPTPSFREDIKAVTYHELKIKKSRGRLETNLIFDI
jgi:SHS2 domain-containing protein